MSATLTRRTNRLVSLFTAIVRGRVIARACALTIGLLVSFLVENSMVLTSPCRAQETEQKQDEKQADQAAQDDPETKARLATEQLICDSIKALDVSLRDNDETVRIDAYRRMLPNQDLLIKLFGEGNGKKLWGGMEPALKKMLTMTERTKESTLAMGALLDVKVRNCREQDSEVQGYDEVLKMIPADVPVYNAAIQFEQGVVVAGTYLVVDNKVHWLRGLEQYPKILKATK